MITAAPLTTELMLLGWSILLLFVHIGIQGNLATRERGLAWNAGSRDDVAPLGRMAGRAQRALDNFKETWPAFIALALGLAVTGRSGGVAAAGAWIWIVARICHLALYLAGVPYVRALAFLASIAGLLMMLARFL